MSPLSRLRKIASGIRHGTSTRVDRLLRDRRHRTALSKIAGSQPRSILVVCLGNICRSPYAAAVLADVLVGQQITITSAGFIGPGRPAPPLAQGAAAEFGKDLSHHRSQLLTSEMLSTHELILVMEPSHRSRLVSEYRIAPGRIVLLGDLDSQPLHTRAIVDPYNGTHQQFVACYQRIGRCVEVLRSAL